MTIIIPLTRGYETIVSDEDGDLAELNWCVYTPTETIRYAGRNERGVYLLIHRVILQRILGRSLTSSELTDHIDGNGLNNTRSNLRLANHRQNRANSKTNSNNKSGFKGIYYEESRKKWRANIRFGGKTKTLGRFSTPEEAHMAYCEAARQCYGEFANGGRDSVVPPGVFEK